MVILVAGTICVDCFNRVAVSQVKRIRIKYFASLMRQNIGWHDIEKSKSNFTVRLSEYDFETIENSKFLPTYIFLTNYRDIEKIKNGIAEQVSHFMNQVMTFILCVIISFVYGWQLTLIVVSYVPIVIIMSFLITKVKLSQLMNGAEIHMFSNYRIKLLHQQRS